MVSSANGLDAHDRSYAEGSEDAVQRIVDVSITSFVYDLRQARLATG